MGNWWANKINGGQPRRPLAPQSPNIPQGFGTRQQATQDYVRRLPHEIPQPEYEPEQGEEIPPGHIPASAAIRNWKGGQGSRTDNAGKCPGCGSSRYMERVNGWTVTTQHGVMHPKPKCFDCGYPDEQGALGIGAKSMGAPQSARQGMVAGGEGGGLWGMQPFLPPV